MKNKSLILSILIIFFTSQGFSQKKQDMIHVKGGTFKMGNSKTNKDNKDESPVHTVKVDDFYIGKYEVTVKEYRSFISSNNYDFGKYFYHKMPSSPDTTWWQGHPETEEYYDKVALKWWGWKNQNPMQHVTWFEAVSYCNWLSDGLGYDKCYYYSSSEGGILCDYSKNGFRLPTEAEWEYAARGGKNNENYKYSGSDNIGTVGWYDENTFLIGPKNVGTKKPNSLGIYDMTGNVWEWCNDFYSPKFYKNSSSDNPINKTPTGFRVIRGGSWHYKEGYATVTSRDGPKPSYTNYNYGFRVVRKK